LRIAVRQQQSSLNCHFLISLRNTQLQQALWRMACGLRGCQALNVKGEIMKYLAVLVNCIVLLGTGVRADDWKFETGFDYFTEYIFRGVDVSKNQPLYEPHLIAGYKGVTFTYIGYYSYYKQPDHPWYVENDLSLDYSKTLGKFTATAGALWYVYDAKSGADTWDLYGVLAYDFPLLNPKLTINWDVDKFRTGYGTASISHPFNLTKSFTITPSAALGIDFGYNSRAAQSNADFNDLLLGLTANLQLNKHLSVHAGVQFSVALNSLRDIGQGNETIGNIGLALAF